jgi:trans-aconitate methyltransferase
MENNEMEFDKFADGYNEIIKKELGIFGKYRETAFTYKVQLLRHILGNKPKSILDFGCGVGSNIPYLHSYFKDTKLYGCDVSSESISIAQAKYPYGDFAVINKIDDLEIYKKIDCIFISSVLHHIPQNEHEYWIGGLYNSLSENRPDRGGGGIL